MNRIKVRDLKFEWWNPKELHAVGITGTEYIVRLDTESRSSPDDKMKLAVCRAAAKRYSNDYEVAIGQYVGLEAAKAACQYHFEKEVRSHIEEEGTE